MTRSQTPELMDNPSIPQEAVDAFHTDLSRLNRILGNNRFISEAVQKHLPDSVLDIGCGEGSLLAELRDTLGVVVHGVDLRPGASKTSGVPITAADATQDRLPASDLALCVLTVHHLNETQVVDLIRNVGLSCRRFLILDLVRHPLPLVLFSLFMRPLMNRIVFEDGKQSIRRAFTPCELRALVVRALSGTGSTFSQWVSPIYGKQVIEITYRA